jgi:lipoprotein-anchoring transpeptidase ErfK/SrfK
MTNDLQTTEKPIQSSFQKFRLLFTKAMKYGLLICAMLFLAGHKKNIPPTQDSTIDFYLGECQKNIEIQTSGLNSSLNIESTFDIQLNRLVTEFYSIRDYKPAWTFNYKTNKNFELLENMLDSSTYFGFPENYFKSESVHKLEAGFLKYSKSGDLRDRIELEILSTKEMFRLLVSLNKGFYQNDTVPQFRNFSTHLPSTVNNALDNDKFSDAISYLQPNLLAYKSLLKSIPDFLQSFGLVKDSSLYALAPEKVSKVLFYAGILPNSNTQSKEEQTLAISKFQEKHNLPADGTLNDSTILQIKQNFEYRFEQICLNVDRLRKLNNSEDNYIFVNIPEYKLHLVENNKETEVYNVIVGAEKTPTPLLSSRINMIIVNPTWTVPNTIVENEMISKIRKDSTYLQRNGFVVVTGKEKLVDMSQIDWSSTNPLGNNLYIRQPGGGDNALGKVKFLFPNTYSVYLHDTPGKSQFKKEKRALSHGCIRVQNPEKLAQKLADDYNLVPGDKINITEMVKTSKTRGIELEKTIEVHLSYITCNTNEKGEVIFLDDIYKLDKREISGLFQQKQAI